MKYLTLLLLFLAPCLASADDASHRQAALKLLDAVKTKEVMHDTFMAIVDAMPMGPGNSKMSPEETADMKQAVVEWFDQDFKWEELQSKMADIYVKAFSEAELNQLIAFYQTPIGQKALAMLPQVLKEAAALGQQYTQTKQSLLIARLQKVETKYAGAKPGN